MPKSKEGISLFFIQIFCSAAFFIVGGIEYLTEYFNKPVGAWFYIITGMVGISSAPLVRDNIKDIIKLIKGE